MNRRTSQTWVLGVWSALAFVPGLPVTWFLFESIRAAACASMLDSGMPEIGPGEAPIEIRHIDWPKRQMSFTGWTQHPRIDVNSWKVVFPTTPTLRHDSSCGEACDRATMIDHLECRNAASTHAVACSLHFWRTSDFLFEPCFLVIDEEGAPTAASPEDPWDPTRAPTECPKSFGWRSR